MSEHVISIEGIKEELDRFSVEINELTDMCSGSPDMSYLNKYEAHMLFVYNNMMKDYSRDSALLSHDSVKIAGGFTYLQNFQLFEFSNKQKESNAIAMYSSDKTVNGKLHGEIWLVPPSVISQLDWQLGNFESTKRFKTNITFHNPNNNAQKMSVNAFIYLGKKDAWKKEDLTLLPRRHISNNKEETFFSFYQRKNTKNK